jgi:CPA1 family monovalent cation:H+ antiporter
MALALSLDRGFPHRDTVIAATFGVVLFSLLIQGLTLDPLVQRLGLANVAGQESEYHRLATERLMCQAALQEMDRLLISEAFPSWAIKVLVNEYGERLAAVEQSIQALDFGERALGTAQEAAARRIALLAEKSMLNEAERRGWLDEVDWRALAEQIDLDLTNLMARGDPAPPRDQRVEEEKSRSA